MPKTIKELRDAQQAAHERGLAILDLAKKEVDDKGNARELTEQEAADVNSAFDERDRLGKQIAYELRAEAYKTDPGSGTGKPRLPNPQRQDSFSDPTDDDPKKARIARRTHTLRHFKKFADGNERAYRMGRFIMACCGHERSLEWCKDRFEMRLHRESVNTQGGYLVPPEIDNDLIDLREQFGVARQYCRISPMMSDTKTRRRRAGGLTAYFVGEGAAITESTKSWDEVKLVAKKLAAIATTTSELNEDSAIDIGVDLSGEMAYAFSNKEDECLFNGDGTSTYGHITGIRQAFRNLGATYTSTAGLVVSAEETYAGVIIGELESLVGKLPVYADTPNVAWFCHKVVYHAIMRRLLDATGGVQPYDIAAGMLPTFMGYPVVFSQVMPKVAAVDQICLILGDIGLGADFGDRRQTTISFSEHATVGGTSVFETDEMAVRGTERFDINVHDVGNYTATAADQLPGPIVALQLAAS